MQGEVSLLPKEIATVLELQTPSGQWQLCKRLYRALGHTPASIPSPPEGIQDSRWATALAVTFLRRRPDVIDLTYGAYSRAINWVNEKLLEQAHARLPPGDLYYPVDEEASRQGRWQQQAREALEECGHAYFLPVPTGDTDNMNVFTATDGDDERRAVRSSSSPMLPPSNSNAHSSRPIADGSEQGGILALQGGMRPRARGARPQTGHRRAATSKAASRRAAARSSRKAAAAVAATREQLERQSHGLHLEVKRAMQVATATLREGDRVESRWRRPTRLDKPRVDHIAWHPGRVVQSHKDGGRVDVVFEDGDGERLSGIPTKYVRRAPSPSSLKNSLISTSGKENDAVASSVERSNSSDPLSSTSTPVAVELLSSASRRELAHIVCANRSLRRTWEDPVPFDQEMARLRMLGEEKTRDRPEWKGSFPAISFQATKKLPFGAGGMAGVRAARAGRAAAGPTAAHDCRRDRRLVRARSRTSSSLSRAMPEGTAGQATSGWSEVRQGGGGAWPVGQEPHKADRRRTTSKTTATATTTTHRDTSTRTPSLSTADLLHAQSRLVAAAVAYDRCVAGARDCLDRGATAFRQARTYSEQQKAFEESTAVLGPSQPARAGYTDWRGRPVAGLQNATLDVVEAMDGWATKWRGAREDDTGVVDEEGEGKVAKDGAVAVVAIATPPFLWEGSPLVSTIIGHSAKLLAGTPELGEWYGPVFPVERNPFFLAYPLDDRAATPRNALVRAWVNGEVITTVSPMLLEEREKEEKALKKIVDKQASAPSWWPSTRGVSGREAHDERIRRAEKIIAREELQVVKGRESVDSIRKPRTSPPSTLDDEI